MGVGVFFVVQSQNQTTEETTELEDRVMEGEDIIMEDDTMEDEGTMEEHEETPMGHHVVAFDGNGYSPKEIPIKKGDTVVFKNESSREMWPATVIHPSHTVYPGSGLPKCFDGDSDTSLLFDACGGIGSGGEYSFVFNEIGSWKYHDHLRATAIGTIIVEE